MKAIAAKMQQAARLVGWGVPKDGENKSQGYSFASAANVKSRVGPALSEVGVAVSSRFEVLKIDDVPTRSGSSQQRVMLRVALTFVDSESGESLTVEGAGSGMDSGDKAVMKAYTAAEKYAYVSAFVLALGEDPENDDADASGRPEQTRREQPRNQSREQPRTPTREQPRQQNDQRREAPTEMWEHLGLTADEATLRAWLVRYLPAIVQWSPQNKDGAWRRVVEQGAKLRIRETRCVELRDAALREARQAQRSREAA